MPASVFDGLPTLRVSLPAPAFTVIGVVDSVLRTLIVLPWLLPVRVSDVRFL